MTQPEDPIVPSQPTYADDSLLSDKTLADPHVAPTADPHVAPHAEVAQQIAAADQTLAARVEELRKTLGKLAPEVTRITGEQKSVWSWLRGGGIVIAFDILLTILGVIYGVNIYNVEHQNDALITSVQAQQHRLDTSVHETCNLYGLFYSFYSPLARDKFPQGAVAYDNGFIRLQNSADRLNCGIKHVVPGT